MKICFANADERGARLVALKAFQEGDEIIREKPLARIGSSMLKASAKSNEEAKQIGERMWQSHVASISKEKAELKLILELSDAWYDPPTAGGIGRTNAIPLGDDNDCEGHALFALICRANHSCHPNARYIWRHDLQRELLIAVRSIQPNSEVTVCYRGSFADRETRRKHLLSEFRFVCNCELCMVDDKHRDELLHKIQYLDDNIPTVAQLRPHKAIGMAEEALELLKSAGMYSPLWTKRLLHDLHQINAMIGNRKAADEWYKKAREAAELGEGGLDPQGVTLPKY